jgi:hypothetical protein
MVANATIGARSNSGYGKVRSMTLRPGTIQRAFELAHDSDVLTVEKIRRRLKAEGYVDWEFQLSGREIRRQLQALVVAKRKRLVDTI